MYIVKRNITELIKELRHNYRAVVKSYELAEITGKQRSSVNRDIRQEINRLDMDGIDTSKLFIETTERDYRNRPRKVFLITSQGVLHLLARYGRYDYQLRYDLTELMKEMDNISEHLYRRR